MIMNFWTTGLYWLLLIARFFDLCTALYSSSCSLSTNKGKATNSGIKSYDFSPYSRRRIPLSAIPASHSGFTHTALIHAPLDISACSWDSKQAIYSVGSAGVIFCRFSRRFFDWFRYFLWGQPPCIVLRPPKLDTCTGILQGHYS